jgi:signal transduction histidine kinase
MTVRLRLALTILLTGLLTAAGVVATVALAFQRFEQESTFARADAFLGRVVGMYPGLLDQHERNPVEFTKFLRNVLLFEPDSQLYLLAADGTVLAHTGQAQLDAGFRVALAPVQQAAAAARSEAARRAAPYVMGDDPEHMNADAVVAARALQAARIGNRSEADGYLYIVCRKQSLAGGQPEAFRSSLAGPALGVVLALIVLGALGTAWIITTITRPLRQLSDEVAAASRDGFSMAAAAGSAPAPVTAQDEFGRLRQGFRAMLATLRQQWDELKRLDHFRRESVSNLSHDLRSPLTATVACLETLQTRWAEAPAQAPAAEDQQLLAVALRNTRNAAGMVRSLGDLALLDEPEFKLRPMRLDLAEVLDDIGLRFAQRAAGQGVMLRVQQTGDASPVATVDVELFERAVANLLDNAFKYTPAGGRIGLGVRRSGADVLVSVQDNGAGIAPDAQPQLFDRLYPTRSSVAPATSEEGKGLGLAIVKRIAELHAGTVEVRSTPGQGTTVTLRLPAG